MKHYCEIVKRSTRKIVVLCTCGYESNPYPTMQEAENDETEHLRSVGVDADYQAGG